MVVSCLELKIDDLVEEKGSFYFSSLWRKAKNQVSQNQVIWVYL